MPYDASGGLPMPAVDAAGMRMFPSAGLPIDSLRSRRGYMAKPWQYWSRWEQNLLVAAEVGEVQPKSRGLELHQALCLSLDRAKSFFENFKSCVEDRSYVLLL